MLRCSFRILVSLLLAFLYWLPCHEVCCGTVCMGFNSTAYSFGNATVRVVKLSKLECHLVWSCDADQIHVWCNVSELHMWFVAVLQIKAEHCAKLNTHNHHVCRERLSKIKKHYDLRCWMPKESSMLFTYLIWINDPFFGKSLTRVKFRIWSPPRYLEQLFAFDTNKFVANLLRKIVTTNKIVNHKTEKWSCESVRHVL